MSLLKPSKWSNTRKQGAMPDLLCDVAAGAQRVTLMTSLMMKMSHQSSVNMFSTDSSAAPELSSTGQTAPLLKQTNILKAKGNILARCRVRTCHRNPQVTVQLGHLRPLCYCIHRHLQIELVTAHAALCKTTLMCKPCCLINLAHLQGLLSSIC